jgi:hypothetical protein
VTTGALSTNQIAYATATQGNNGETLTVKDGANDHVKGSGATAFS